MFGLIYLNSVIIFAIIMTIRNYKKTETTEKWIFWYFHKPFIFVLFFILVVEIIIIFIQFHN